MFIVAFVVLFFFFSSRRRHTRCALVTGVQTCALQISLYGYRAGVEAARFSKHVAKQVYGREPDYSYVWGGSGAGRRSPLHLEYCDGVYTGALPFMGDGNFVPHGPTPRVRRRQQVHSGSLFNFRRLLERQEESRLGKECA